ncbi:MAG: histidine kinase [Bacteroidales bacterium]|nr:histidine kinase [Bacteroidales bacterium]
MEKKRTRTYFMTVISISVVAILFSMICENLVMPKLPGPPPNMFPSKRPVIPDGNSIFMSHRINFEYRRAIYQGFFIVITLFISTIYRNNSVVTKREQKMLELQNQVLTAESKLLKWQINPHFLFNTLNNIYTLAQLRSDKTSYAIQRLSEMLRYVIYECNESFVPLRKELDYIRAYIELQLLKDSEIKNVNYRFECENTKLKIAPLLLITFVENSFKHSNFQETGTGWIDILVRTNGNELMLSVRNSLTPFPKTKDDAKGIGLNNVIRRLDLLYEDRYQLKIDETEDEYKVELKLILDENQVPDS